MPDQLVDGVELGDVSVVYSPDLVDLVVDKAGRREQRRRLLPARLMVYFLLGRALFCPDPYREVLRRMTGVGADPVGGWHLPDKAAVFRARQRLGCEPLRALLGQVGGGIATAATPGAFWRGHRLMALDGTTMDAADTPANRAGLSGPKPRLRGQGPVGYPQARTVVLVESGTHTVVDAEAGPWSTGERALAARLVRSLRPDMLVLADRGFPGVQLWQTMADTGAHLLWRVSGLWKLPPGKVLADGSWISMARHDCGPHKDRTQIQVRVIEYLLDDPGRDRAVRYRLITTLLNPAEAPAAELAALYSERWEVEGTLKEIKTVQLGPRTVLPSKTPDLVFQDIYAHLAVHTAIRILMHRAAVDRSEPLDPDRLSFSAALRATRRSVHPHPGIFPPGPRRP
ncbi:hypothetical protein GCM10010329_81990 [Streptomyces spiroverticillatus]|uniref:IS4 family transposase n=1 Tax=Streptomyces finlayi TaxID=67296 RepID=A0A918X9L1_9ACTN|nr:IS4 family transposase [Streptomyces finlayi]GHA46999.1 hypothetical protein GCM10010329_81990 [Streptomyces spiroverticillatus]GHD18318.1 hypothetical protein GCM10010334_81070 [Streptomyces finlayi]